MKKFVLFTLLTAFMMGCFAIDADAQYRKRKKKKKKKEKTEQNDPFDESGGFAHRLWYGGSFNLGFSGSSGNSAFGIGITPMVGYKIFDPFSVGPRAGINYTLIKGTDISGQTRNANLVSYSAGIFTRYKVFSNFFVHGELEYENEELIFTDGRGLFALEPNGDLATQRRGQENAYLGLGYSSGSIIAYEVYLLYNFLEPEDSLNLPIAIRFGLTYKF